jgi:ADP-ribose pyrophosphatase YjhB (NUDIX family)
MVFAFSPDFKELLLLRKPDKHKNVLFRGNWTVPGGHIEAGESDISGAVREFAEETALMVDASQLSFVLSFACDCDPTEDEHMVSVYGIQLSRENLKLAYGTYAEPVMLFGTQLPANLLWYIRPLMKLVVGRLSQPAR